MNQPTLINFLQTTYTLPALHNATPVAAGYLSRNWLIDAADRRYFLKQYRFTDGTRVTAAHASLFHFHRAGLPTIVPLATNDGQTFCSDGSHFYSLFPFVAGRQLQRGALSVRAVQSMGAMLAQLHRAGQNVALPHVQPWQAKDRRLSFVSEATAILELIARQPTLTPFDRLAEQTLRRQLALVEQTPMAFATLTLRSDHLLHGDYHDSNLFFNVEEEVSHLFDWEKTEIAPRELELVRALLFTCFSNPENFRGTFKPHNFDLAAAFLTAYHARYPIEAQRFIDALHARYWGSLCSLWVVDEHYRQQNDRVDLFLEANLAEINYFADHTSQLIEWLSSLWP